MGKLVRIKHCKVEVIFDIWEDEMKVEDIPQVINDAVDHAGYSCAQMPEVVQVVEKMEPWGEEEEEDE